MFVSVSDIHYPQSDNFKPLTLKISDPGSFTSQQRPVISPSASIRSRPQSFAQKLRSTGKTVKGYVNLSEGVGTPLSVSSTTGSALERITGSSDKSTGKCWKTIYNLLELYANMPDTKTIKHRFSVGTYDISEHYKGNRKYDILTEMRSIEDMDKSDSNVPQNNPPLREPSKEYLFTFNLNKCFYLLFLYFRLCKSRSC